MSFLTWPTVIPVELYIIISLERTFDRVSHSRLRPSSVSPPFLRFSAASSRHQRYLVRAKTLPRDSALCPFAGHFPAKDITTSRQSPPFLCRLDSTTINLQRSSLPISTAPRSRQKQHRPFDSVQLSVLSAAPPLPSTRQTRSSKSSRTPLPP